MEHKKGARKLYIETLLCETIHSFVKERVAELKEAYEVLGFKDEDDMLSQIKKDPQIALWALSDLCVWGLGKDYSDEFVVDETEIHGYTYFTYRLGDSFIFVDEDSNGNPVITEVEKVTEMVEVTRWKKLE